MPVSDTLIHQTIQSVNIAIHVINNEFRIQYFNDALIDFCRRIGFPIDDPSDQFLFDLFPFLSEKVREEYELVFRTGETLITEEKSEFGDVAVITKTEKKPILEDGRAKFIITLLEDITAASLAQQALSDSETFNRAVIENSPLGISVRSPKGKLLSVNDAWKKIWDISDETLQKYLAAEPDQLRFDTKDDYLKDWRSKVERVYKEGITLNIPELETRHYRPSKTGWVSHTFYAIKDKDENVDRVIILTNDITERKLAEIALRDSEEKYRLLMESIPAGITLIDRDGKFLFINNVGAINFGKDAGDIIGSHQHDHFPQDLADIQLKNIRKAIDQKIEFTEEVKTFINNRWRWYILIFKPYQDTKEGKTCALIISTDVTRRKEDELSLKESEERYRLHYLSVPVPTYTWQNMDNDFVLVDYNRAAETITDGKIIDFIGQKAGTMYAQQPEILDEMNKCLSEKANIIREMPYLFKTTNRESCLIVHYVFVPPGLVVVHTEDITDRKRAEEIKQKAYDDLEHRVQERTRELAEVNEALEVEREALHQKNIALQEILGQVEKGKQQMATQIKSNVDRIVMPILDTLDRKADAEESQYLALLKGSLADIVSPFISLLESHYTQLAQRELEICNMIKNGFNSKEIANALNTSVQTVFKQRTTIRRKLGIANKKINLASYLQSIHK